ncbi:MAG: Asp-tRNA(Asn)/Glu-tRNA(Gln) amidotransferase subunit GatB [Myxococcota bacterium]
MSGAGAEGRRWEPVIGLEVHAQLRTRTKLFSSAPNDFGAAPNSRTNEVDLGMPGVLPVLNAKAFELAVRAALALGCQVHPVSIFARKHYFYPDLPKGYQISQYEEPFATGGAVPIELDGDPAEIALTRIHMEEDAGKLIHDPGITGGATSHVDLNRAGVPLIEIVSEPDLCSPEQAGAYLRSLRSILRYIDASDADMEKGNFRCDANVSVRRAGERELGTKVELKNLNSFRFVERALAYEIERQIDVLEEGGSIVQETRLWDDRTGATRAMRTKEYAHDYRYFPDPDLVPICLDAGWIDARRRELPELPAAKRRRYVEELGLPPQDARQLTEDREIAGFFEETLKIHPHPKTVANWVMRNLLEVVSESDRSLEELPLTPVHLAELLALVDSGRLTAASARKLLPEIARSGTDPETLMRAQGLEAVSDVGELEGMAREVLDANADQVAKYQAGEEKLFHFFVGQIMRRTRGKASPGVVRQVLQRLLDDRRGS